jgi:hypothetical protein
MNADWPTPENVPGAARDAKPVPRAIADAETDLQTEIQNLRSAIMRTVVVLDRFCETVARARDAVEQMDLTGDKRQARSEDKWE